MSILETTLCLLKKDDKILLALKKRGFGAGKYNGVGGKLENGESPEEAMIRECSEEIGVKPTEYEKVGYIYFDEYYKGNKEQVAFHLYVATKWDGVVVESDEMEPKWFSISEIPYDEMFPDDQYWLPLVLDGKKIKAYFNFDPDWNIISSNIEEVDVFDTDFQKKLDEM